MSDPSSGTIPATTKNAETTKIATINSSALTAQETINAVGVGVGANFALGASSSQNTTTINANNTLNAARQQAEMLKQVTIDNARDVVRGTYLARS